MHFSSPLKQSLMNANFAAFVKQTSVYPLYGVANPPANKKEEDRYTNVCEKLYSFSVTLLSEMRQAWSELQVCYLFDKNIKHTYVMTHVGKFDAYLSLVNKKYSEMVKSEPELKFYYESFRLSNEELQSVFKIALSDTDGSQACIDAYKTSFAETKKMLSERFK